MLHKKIIILILALSCICNTQAKENEKPNILVVMVDDLGFSDLGSYGGEIKTPNIDKLAQNGIRFSQFKNTSRCSPSRAALLTGRSQHNVDMGWMSAVDEHRLGHRGQISNSIPTIAEVLKIQGYQNYMSGKWHLTLDGNFQSFTAIPNGSWPTQRGFDQFYGGLSGGGSFWKPKYLARNLTRIPRKNLPQDYYYTHAITNNAVQFIKQHDTQKPMFMYLAHYAPHRPLQAPENRIEKNKNRYQLGYDVLRQQRFERQKKLGFFPKNAVLPRHDREYGGKYLAWKNLSKDKQQQWIGEMATYAAMVEIVDDGIGEVIAELKKQKMFDNTIIVFISDNGATSEGGIISQLAADLSNTPYRGYKRWVFEGGVNSPLIVHWPKGLQEGLGEIRHELTHITDIMPTFLDLASIKYPNTFRANKLTKLDGRSFASTLKNKRLASRPIFFEHQSSCSIIDHGWKLIRYSKDTPWELYQLSTDPFETQDLAKSHKVKLQELESKWQIWAKNNKVLPLVNMEWTQRINHFTKINPDQDGVDNDK